jgi:hypothetical protein
MMDNGGKISPKISNQETDTFPDMFVNMQVKPLTCLGRMDENKVSSLDVPGIINDRILKLQLEDDLIITSEKEIKILARDSDLIRCLLEDQKDDIELRLSVTRSEWNSVIKSYGFLNIEEKTSLASRSKMLILAYYLGASALISNLSLSFLCGSDKDVISYQDLDDFYHIVTDKSILSKINNIERLLFASIYIYHAPLFIFIFDQLSHSRQSRIIEYMIRLQYNDLLIDRLKSRLLCLTHLKHTITHNNIIIFKHIISNLDSAAQSLTITMKDYMCKLKRREMLMFIFDKIPINQSSIFDFIPLIKHSPELLQQMLLREDFVQTVCGREFHMARMTIEIILSSNDNLSLFQEYESFCKRFNLNLKIIEEEFYLIVNDCNGGLVESWLEVEFKNRILPPKSGQILPSIDMSPYPNIFQYILANYMQYPANVNLTSNSEGVIDILRNKSNHFDFAQFIAEDEKKDEDIIDSSHKYPGDDHIFTRHWRGGISQYAEYNEYCKYEDYGKSGMGWVSDGPDISDVPANIQINEIPVDIPGILGLDVPADIGDLTWLNHPIETNIQPNITDEKSDEKNISNITDMEEKKTFETHTTQLEAEKNDHYYSYGGGTADVVEWFKPAGLTFIHNTMPGTEERILAAAEYNRNFSVSHLDIQGDSGMQVPRPLVGSDVFDSANHIITTSADYVIPSTK